MPRAYHRSRKIDFAAIGEKYGVCPRTVRRWHKKLGHRIHDPAQVAFMLANQRLPKPAALAAAAKILQHENHICI